MTDRLTAKTARPGVVDMTDKPEPKRAEPAKAWGIVRNGVLLHLAMPGRPDHVALLSDERIARVEIREIDNDE